MNAWFSPGGLALAPGVKRIHSYCHLTFCFSLPGYKKVEAERRLFSKL